jgi:hypothetical protein
MKPKVYGGGVLVESVIGREGEVARARRTRESEGVGGSPRRGASRRMARDEARAEGGDWCSTTLGPRCASSPFRRRLMRRSTRRTVERQTPATRRPDQRMRQNIVRYFAGLIPEVWVHFLNQRGNGPSQIAPRRLKTLATSWVRIVMSRLTASITIVTAIAISRYCRVIRTTLVVYPRRAPSDNLRGMDTSNWWLALPHYPYLGAP